MSGEFLRGVLDENCLFKETALYTLEILVPNPTPTVLTGFLPIRADAYFLLMAFYPLRLIAGPSVTLIGTTTIELFDPKSSFNYASPPLAGDLAGDGINTPFCFPEYVLFEPSGMIGLRVYPNAASLWPLNPGDTVSLGLFGMEYRE